MTTTAATAAPLSGPVRTYLADPSLAPMWAAARERLERNGLAPTGSALTPTLTDDGRERLAGLLGDTAAGRAVRAGRGVRLADLDAALRASAAGRGVLAVVADLTGSALTDRTVARARKQADTGALWATLDARLTQAGLSCAEWVPPWLAGVRRAGLLTRAGAEALTVVADVVTVLADLAQALPLAEPAKVLAAALPAEPSVELAELAGRALGDAHALDDGTVTAAVLVRALSAAAGTPLPRTAVQRRELWATFGVTPDNVSGTVLVWALQPPGDGAWARMMRERTALGLVSHVTLQEWQVAAGHELWAAPGSIVSVCENPQVLQAAARAGSGGPLLCLAGNPATVGLRAVDGLLSAGAVVRYHGDFDAAGVAIAARLIKRGAAPWAFDEDAYRQAVARTRPAARLALLGTVPGTPWDGGLSATMRELGIAVHEEALLADLLADMPAQG